MKQTIHSCSASSTPTGTFEKRIGTSSGSASSSGDSTVVIGTFDGGDASPAPAGFTNIDDLVAEFEKDPEAQAALAEGRKWVVETYYDDFETISAIRLKKGWSQTHLAEVMGTSQSHIARIEKGRDNLTLKTLRGLCKALDIDMNTLDAALYRQEATDRRTGQ